MSETIGDIIKNSIAEAASQASFAPQISGLDIAAKDIDEYEAKAKIAAERTAELEREVTTLRDAMNGLKDEKGVTELEAKVSRFTKTMTAAKKEVEAFLIQEQLIGSKNENIGAYKKYIDQVAEGYKTASQVITQIKADLNMAGNDGGAVDSGFMKGLLATLSQISESIDSVKEKIDSLKQDGITISGGDAAVNSGKSFTNMLEAIEQSSEKAGEDISETRKQMVDLLTAVNAFANVDNSKLFAVTEAFKGMANIGEGSFGSKSLNNLIDSVKKLQEVSANGGAIQLVFDIQGIQDLKVRKTSLNNLATYLPIISQRVNPENIQKIFAADPTNGINNLKVGKSSGLDLLNEKLPALSFINVDNLKALFGIDTSGINSLKVSKASVANVEKLALAAQILRENNVDLTFQGDVTEELKEIANNIGLTKDEAKETDTALDNVKNTIDETTVSANKLGDSVQEALEPLSGITVKRPAVSDFKGSITDALRDEYHMEATDIDKVTQALGVQEGQLKKVTAAHREYVDGTEKIQHVSSVTVQTVRDLGDGIQKVSTSVADFNPIRDDDGNIINWGVAITRGYEQISVAAKEAADAQEDFVDKGKAIKELQGLQVDIQRSLDKAAANGVVDNEAIDRLRACQQTYSDFENVVRDNNITLTNYKAIMDGVKGSVSEANKELGFSVDLQRAEAAAAKEAASAQEDFVDKGKAINELQGLQSDIQKSIDDAASKGIVDNESLDRLRTYQQTFSDLEDVVRNNDVSLSNYKAITDAVRSSVTEANKELGFSVQLYREDEAAAKAAAKAEAELANTVQARGAIGKATAGVDKTVSGAQAVGVSVDNADLQQLAVYRQLLAELDAELDDLNLTQKEFSTIMGNLKAIFQAPEAAVKKLTASLKEQQNHIAKSAKIYDAVKSATEEYADAQNDSNSNVRAAYTVITNLRRELDGAATSYKNGKITAAQYDEAVKSTNDELNEQVKVLKNAGYGADETASKFAQLTQQLTRFITPLYLARKAWQTVKEMANVVIELEDAFAQLQIVTGATDDELEEFYETSAKIAADLGKSITDIAASIEVFSRLGYSLPDATQLAQYATILSNVAGVSTDEATTGLTSIIKGYNMHVEKAEHVSDVLISIGQKYAVSAGEMMEAYERSGAALAATNTSFEKSAAIIAAANAAIQNSSTVGKVLPIHTVMYA